MASTRRSFTTRLLEGAAALTARTWPLAARLLPERLEFDDTPSLWHAGTPDYQPRPPLRGAISADLAIIGGGFTGVSTAYHLAHRFPQRRIILLEATSLANGASGRNGGLALNWINGIDTSDPDLTRKVYDLTSAGLVAIRTLIERHCLPVDHRFDGTLTLHTSPERAEAAHAEAEYLQALGIPVRFLHAGELRSQFDACGVYGATLEPETGQINGAQFVRGLRPILEERSVAIYEQTPGAAHSNRSYHPAHNAAGRGLRVSSRAGNQWVHRQAGVVPRCAISASFERFRHCAVDPGATTASGLAGIRRVRR